MCSGPDDMSLYYVAQQHNSNNSTNGHNIVIWNPIPLWPYSSVEQDQVEESVEQAVQQLEMVAVPVVLAHKVERDQVGQVLVHKVDWVAGATADTMGTTTTTTITTITTVTTATTR